MMLFVTSGSEERFSHSASRLHISNTPSFPMRLLLCLFTLCTSLCAAASQPNIIIHFIDDLGYGDIGPFGAVKQKTPHLDRMAREGMKLTTTSDQRQTARASRC